MIYPMVPFPITLSDPAPRLWSPIVSLL